MDAGWPAADLIRPRSQELLLRRNGIHMAKVPATKPSNQLRTPPRAFDKPKVNHLSTILSRDTQDVLEELIYQGLIGRAQETSIR